MMRFTKQMLWLFGLLFIAVMLFSPSAIFAQEPSYQEVNEIAKQLNCPTCAGRNLSDCDTVTCEQWRGQISDLIQDGYNEQQVLDFFAERYGTQVLQSPPLNGFTLILWILPILAMVLGGGWLYFTMRRWTEQQTPTMATTASEMVISPSSTEVDDNYLRQVDRDLGIE